MPKHDDISVLSRPTVAALLASLCAVLWGSAFPGIKLGYALFSVGTDDTAAKFMFAGVRFALAGLLVLLFRAAGKRTGRGRAAVGSPLPEQKVPVPLGGGRAARILRPLLLIGSLGLAQTGVQYAFFYLGVSYTSGAKGAILNGTSVFFSALLAHLLHADDRLSPRKAAGVLLGFAGIVLVNWRRDLGMDFSLRGEGFVLISALLLSASALYSKRVTTKLDPVLVSGGQLLAGGLALTAAGRVLGADFPSGSSAAWLMLAYLSSMSAVAFTIWTALLKHNRVSSVSIFNSLIPVAGTVLSALFLGEAVLELRFFLAIPAVAAGIALVNGADRKRPASA